ncbi:BnaC05g29550D [Brassica napus]|uniref:BnaC05g29550D protein n=1 Tax=Brassica napus TaxID=3708 RepID=A0A078FBE4_BRANA|nr:BnaC05g29550D [Brassica napus]
MFCLIFLPNQFIGSLSEFRFFGSHVFKQESLDRKLLTSILEFSDMMPLWDFCVCNLVSQHLILSLGSNHRLEGFFPDYSSSSIIADVIICENMFRVLTSSSSSAGAPLRFFVYDKYLKGLKRNSRVVTTLQKYFQSIWTIGIITLHSRGAFKGPSVEYFVKK